MQQGFFMELWAVLPKDLSKDGARAGAGTRWDLASRLTPSGSSRQAAAAPDERETSRHSDAPVAGYWRPLSARNTFTTRLARARTSCAPWIRPCLFGS